MTTYRQHSLSLPINKAKYKWPFTSLTGNVVVEDVAHVDLERAPGGFLQEAERRQEALVLLDDVYLLRPASQERSRDSSRPRPDFHDNLPGL